jgi:hypothetical protein
MKKENESNGFLGFMNIIYFLFIGVGFIGGLITMVNLSEDSGGISILIVLIILLQSLVIYNLIILNKNLIVEKIEIISNMLIASIPSSLLP